MKATFKALVPLVVLALVLVACQPPASQELTAPPPAPPPTKPASATQAPRAALIRPTVTPIQWTTDGPDLPAQPVSTATVRVMNLSDVRINVSDLPAGFEELDAAAQERIGLTEASLAAFYNGAFSQATPQNYFALINAAPESFEFALGLLFSPLTQAEKTAFDAEFADKNQAVQHFSENFNGNAKLILGSEQVGEKSAGFSFISETGSVTMRGDLWIVRTQNVVMLVMVLYQDGKEPPIQAARIATLLDVRLRSILNR
jgi:hypothetical protein